MRRLRLAAVLLPLLALGAPAWSDGDKPATPRATKKIDNPEYAQWAVFKVGAFVELTTESNQGGMSSTLKMAHKLLELTAEKAVVETTMTTVAGGQEMAMPAQKRDVPKVVEVPDVQVPETKPVDAPKVKEGEETIEVGGKKVACKTFETTMEFSGMQTWRKTWTSKEIPGQTAKMESKTEGKVGEVTISSSSKTTVTKFGTGS